MRNYSETNLPYISILIPCRNEERYIGKCLESIISNNYPKDKIEILVVDGMSKDRTRDIIKKFQITNPKSQIQLFDNPRKFTPFAFNIGTKKARGEVIMLMGAHAIYEKDYVSKCVKYLEEYNADNVGGVMKVLPSKNTLCAKAIAISLSHSFGAGGSHFRIGIKEPREVDTVFGGCYKREVFEKIGLFNEKLKRSQDMEFNLRLKRAGGKILLAPDIISYYYPKDNLRDFFKHNFRDGVWAILPLKFVKLPFKLRHYIPLIFVLTLPLSIWFYFLFSLFFSVQIAFQEKNFKLFFLMPIAFFCRHFGYGFGSLWGLVKIFSK